MERMISRIARFRASLAEAAAELLKGSMLPTALYSALAAALLALYTPFEGSSPFGLGCAIGVWYAGVSPYFALFGCAFVNLLQGMPELAAAGMDVTLQCDNMSASLMKQGKINAVFVGCDRMAANGDFANKIGTLGVAVIAARYNVPFYVCVPVSSIDPDTPDGDHIIIEERPEAEVTAMWYKERMAPEGIKVYNPAFDVTDHELVTAVITERGIARAPFDISLREICILP